MIIRDHNLTLSQAANWIRNYKKNKFQIDACLYISTLEVIANKISHRLPLSPEDIVVNTISHMIPPKDMSGHVDTRDA